MNFFLFILTRSAFLRLLFWGKNGKFQEGVFVFIVAILSSAAQGLRTIKGIVLDIFPWNLHTLCNLLFPMSWHRVFSKKNNFGSGLHLRIAENLDSDFRIAILPSAAPGLRTIKGIVLDIFPWNLHTLCNLLFPMSWHRVFSKKINFGSGLHLRIAENLDYGISNPKLWTQLWIFETSHCHGIEYSLTLCEIWVENDKNCLFYKAWYKVMYETFFESERWICIYLTFHFSTLYGL